MSPVAPPNNIALPLLMKVIVCPNLACGTVPVTSILSMCIGFWSFNFFVNFKIEIHTLWLFCFQNQYLFPKSKIKIIHFQFYNIDSLNLHLQFNHFPSIFLFLSTNSFFYLLLVYQRIIGQYTIPLDLTTKKY